MSLAPNHACKSSTVTRSSLSAENASLSASSTRLRVVAKTSYSRLRGQVKEAVVATGNKVRHNGASHDCPTTHPPPPVTHFVVDGQKQKFIASKTKMYWMVSVAPVVASAV